MGRGMMAIVMLVVAMLVVIMMGMVASSLSCIWSECSQDKYTKSALLRLPKQMPFFNTFDFAENDLRRRNRARAFLVDASCSYPARRRPSLCEGSRSTRAPSPTPGQAPPTTPPRSLLHFTTCALASRLFERYDVSDKSRATGTLQ